MTSGDQTENSKENRMHSVEDPLLALSQKYKYLQFDYLITLTSK